MSRSLKITIVVALTTIALIVGSLCLVIMRAYIWPILHYDDLKKNPGGRLPFYADKENLLIIAAHKGDITVLERLLKMGVSVNGRTGYNQRTALMCASGEANLKAAQFLLDQGADVNLADHSGETALMIAAWGGGLESVRFLLKRGADPNLRNTFGESALARARAFTRDKPFGPLAEETRNRYGAVIELLEPVTRDS